MACEAFHRGAPSSLGECAVTAPRAPTAGARARAVCRAPGRRGARRRRARRCAAPIASVRRGRAIGPPPRPARRPACADPTAARGSRLAPPAAADGKTVKLSFKLPYRVHFGQDICIVGSSEALGNWDPSRGVGLRWSEGDVWEVEFEVSAG
jgi:hypothetical protein